MDSFLYLVSQAQIIKELIEAASDNESISKGKPQSNIRMEQAVGLGSVSVSTVLTISTILA